MSTDLTTLAPEVQTLAKPASLPLLAARGEVGRNPVLKAAFERARAEKLTPTELVILLEPELRRTIEGTDMEILAVACYLADEFFQLGDAILVIDRVTGRALARITDEDIWTPEMVPREDGRMAQPLPRLRPDLQGFLVSHYFNEAKDQDRLALVQKRYPQTLALQDVGNPRLRVITRVGRASMTEELRDQLASILGAVRGSSKAFLDHFEVTDILPSDPSLIEVPRATAVSRSQQSVIDPLTFNLRHNRVSAHAARIGTAWVRHIAARVVSMAEGRVIIKTDDLCSEVLEPADFWVVPPHAHTTFMPFAAGLLPVEGVEPTGLLGKVGVIHISPTEGYSVQAREVFGRWEVTATLDYTLYLYPELLFGISVPDIPIEVMAEIV